MNAKELISNLNKSLKEEELSMSEFVHQDYEEEIDVRFEEKFGKMERIFQGRPLGHHDEYLCVIKFVDHGVYIAMSGYYDSWSGTNWSDTEFQEVLPVERTYISYELVK